MCGTCCMHLGDYIAIERQIGPYTFEACSVSTGTPFIAHVDDDKQSLYDYREWTAGNPSACPFLRPKCDGHIVCTIHMTSPPQCKSYRCVVMQVFSQGGEKIGKVTGTLALMTDDLNLRGIWEEGEREAYKTSTNPEMWMEQYLNKRGYSVI